MVSDLPAQHELVIAPVEQVGHAVVREGPQTVQVVRLLRQLYHKKDQRNRTAHTHQDHLHVVLSSLEGEQGAEGVHQVVRVDEEVRQDPEVNTEVEQEEPHYQSQQDEAHQEDEQVEGHVPDADLQPHGPKVEKHESDGNDETDEQEKGQFASWFGDHPGVETFLAETLELRASWDYKLGVLFLCLGLLSRITLERYQ